MKTPQELLHQALEVGECLLPDAPPGGRSAHPTVFVHGLLGWGAQDALYRAVPYWGLAAGDVLGYLNRCGYDCRAASVGIISSAWDRACSPAAGPTTASRTRSTSVTRASARHIPRRSCPAGARTGP